MKTASAPSQLPFVPRPFINELFSSWMLRIADANCVSLQELKLGFQCRHPDVPCPNSLDWGFSPAFLKAMARFCRTPISTLHSLDLRTRLPQAEKCAPSALESSLRSMPEALPRAGRLCLLSNLHLPTTFMYTFAGNGPSLPCSVVMFTRVSSDTVVPCVVKKTHFPSAPLRLSCGSSAGNAEQT